MFGSIGGFFPVRLGGTSQNGVTAAQHSRFCADLVAVRRTAPIASWSFVRSGATVTISGYVGQNGAGAAHAPNAEEVDLGGVTGTLFTWPAGAFTDPLDENVSLPVVLRAVQASSLVSTRLTSASLLQGGVAVAAFSHAGADLEEQCAVRVWGTIGELKAIGDYGGDPNKHDSETEGRAPYAEFLLLEFQSQRGTAYTKEEATLVDVENVALARFFTACGPRLAEKFRKNCLPGTSDERLPYWERVLAVPKKPGEPKWRTRQKLAAHYMGSKGSTNEEVRARLTALLGDVFVDMTWSQGVSLSAPPPQTFWPVINPGDPTLSLGGGAWTSERNVLVVTVQRPSNMTVGDFFTLLDVDMFQMLDQMLPAWAGFSYTIQADTSGFILGESLLGFTALTDS